MILLLWYILIISHIGNTHGMEIPTGNTGNGTSVDPTVSSGNQIAVLALHLAY